MKARMRGATVREVLIKRNLSLTEWAARLGVSESAVTLWLTGQREPDPDNRKAILRSLNMTWDQVFEVIHDTE